MNEQISEQPRGEYSVPIDGIHRCVTLLVSLSAKITSVWIMVVTLVWSITQLGKMELAQACHLGWDEKPNQYSSQEKSLCRRGEWRKPNSKRSDHSVRSGSLMRGLSRGSVSAIRAGRNNPEKYKNPEGARENEVCIRPSARSIPREIADQRTRILGDTGLAQTLEPESELLQLFEQDENDCVIPAAQLKRPFDARKPGNDQAKLAELEKLRESDQEILNWIYCRGCSLEEVADAMGISRADAAQRQLKAIRRLSRLI